MAEDIAVGVRADGRGDPTALAGWAAVGLIATWSIAGVIFGLYGIREVSGRADVLTGPVVYVNLWQSINVDISGTPASQVALVVCALWLLATALLLPALALGRFYLVKVRRAGKARATLYVAVLTMLVLVQFWVQTWGDRNVVPQSGAFQPSHWEQGYSLLALSAVAGLAFGIVLLRPWGRRGW